MNISNNTKNGLTEENYFVEPWMHATTKEVEKHFENKIVSKQTEPSTFEYLVPTTLELYKAILACHHKYNLLLGNLSDAMSRFLKDLGFYKIFFFWKIVIGLFDHSILFGSMQRF